MILAEKKKVGERKKASLKTIGLYELSKWVGKNKRTSNKYWWEVTKLHRKKRAVKRKLRQASHKRCVPVSYNEENGDCLGKGGGERDARKTGGKRAAFLKSK